MLRKDEGDTAKVQLVLCCILHFNLLTIDGIAIVISVATCVVGCGC